MPFRNFCRLCLVGLISVTSLSSFSQDINRQIAKCAGEINSAERLVCFDELSKELGVDKPTKSNIKTQSKWIVEKDKSPIDDSINVTMALEAESTIQSSYKSSTPVLVIRCKENRTSLYIQWGVYLTTQETYVLSRLDREKPVTAEWNISSDYEATFYPNSPSGYFRGRGALDLIPFIKELMFHETLLVQTTPYGASPVITSFDIKGLTDAITPLRETCNW